MEVLSACVVGGLKKFKESAPVVVMVGTRPEVIKMVSVYQELKLRGIPVLLCSTSQHTQLLTELFTVFGIVPDFDLDVGQADQDLFHVTERTLSECKKFFSLVMPSMVLVQGDTTTAMAASLAAFYCRIPVGHVEAGLRTDDKYQPYPEEVNRRLIAQCATYHFAPTSAAQEQLLKEGIPATTVFHTGNTVVDALYYIKDLLVSGRVKPRSDLEQAILSRKHHHKKIVVLTIHRRESFDGGITRVLRTVQQMILQNPHLFFIYPVHPNPSVQRAIREVGLCSDESMHMTTPLSYVDMVYALLYADMVMTDSGGIQEEAVSLGKPVVVLRDKTERMEGVYAGCARLVGTDPQKIVSACSWALAQKRFEGVSVYGNGYAGKVIADCVERVRVQVLGMSKKEGALASNHHSSVIGKDENRMTSEKRGTRMFDEKQEYTVTVIGLGYIGLPTAIMAADSACQVVGFDVNEQRVAAIQDGNPTIYEPGIEERLQRVLHRHLRVTTEIAPAHCFIVAVPTPTTEEKKADLSYVFKAVESLASVIKSGDVVILESTIPVGTTDRVAQYLVEKTGLIVGESVFVAHCPERVFPGKIFTELVTNDRVIGGVTRACAQKAREFYARFVTGTVYLTDARSAEMVKLIENSSRDVSIAFANQVASMAHACGIDPYRVIELANKHPRVNILRPGCGVGGHCIAVDPWFLVEGFPEQTSLLKAARVVNDSKPLEVLGMIKQRIARLSPSSSPKRTVLVLGLSYKPDSDDLRESPALHIAHELSLWPEIDVVVSEPHVSANTVATLLPKVTYGVFEEHAPHADLVVCLVAHSRYKMWIHSVDKNKILDVCGLLHRPWQSEEQELNFRPAAVSVDEVYIPPLSVKEREHGA